MTNPKTSPVAESVVEQVAIEAAAKVFDSLAGCTIPLNFAAKVRAGEQSELVDAFRAAVAAAMPRLIEDDTPTDAGEGVEHKPWHETDAHRDLSRIIPDMEGKIAEAEVKFAHCLPEHLFAPLKGSITELRSLRHELAHPTPTDTGLVGELVEALEKARDSVFFVGEPGQIVEIDALIAKAKDTPHG